MKKGFAAIVLCISLLLMCSATLLAEEKVVIPTFEPPKVQLPTPNAYDYFTAAADLLVNSDSIGSKYTSSAFNSKIVSDNKAALDKLREGFKYQYLEPAQYGMDAEYAYFSKYKLLSRLFVHEALLKEECSDWNGAADSLLDGMEFGAKVSNGAPLIGSVVSLGTRNIARNYFWSIIPNLDSKALKSALLRFEKIQSMISPFYNAIEHERISNLMWLQDCFNGKYKSENKELKWCEDLVKLPDYTKAKTLNDYNNYANDAIARMKLPYDKNNVFPELKSSENMEDKVADIIMSIIYPTYTNIRIMDVNVNTQDEILKTSLALQAYKADNGQYPENLEMLVPAYLKSVPTDPFGNNAKLLYKKSGDEYTLWSVGPDGKDDGAKPIINPEWKTGEPESSKYASATSDSIGDIVAGLNK